MRLNKNDMHKAGMIAADIVRKLVERSSKGADRLPLYDHIGTVDALSAALGNDVAWLPDDMAGWVLDEKHPRHDAVMAAAWQIVDEYLGTLKTWAEE